MTALLPHEAVGRDIRRARVRETDLEQQRAGLAYARTFWWGQMQDALARYVEADRDLDRIEEAIRAARQEHQDLRALARVVKE